MNTIEVYRKEDSAILNIGNITDTLITETINGEYNFSFTHYKYDLSKHLRIDSEVNVDGQRFRISTKTKSRKGTPTMYIVCDHISYRLADDDSINEKKIYKGTPTQIANELLKGSSFKMRSVNFSAVIELETSALTARGKLIELANKLKGELFFDNFSIDLLAARGLETGAIFKTGGNVLSVHEVNKTINSIQNAVERSREIDIVDFSRIPPSKRPPGYEDAKRVNLGDNIQVIDIDLEIDTKARVIKKQYDPFRKEVPQITVGSLVPDVVNEGVVGAAKKEVGGAEDNYYIEFGRAALSDEMGFDFNYTEGYDGEAYVTYGVTSSVAIPSGLSVRFKNDYNAAGKITGVTAYSNFSAVAPGVVAFVNIHAICGGL